MSRIFQSRNNKFTYYLSGHLRRVYPRFLLNLNLEKLRKSITNIDEKILYERLDYYYKSPSEFSLNDESLNSDSLDHWYLSKIKDIGYNHGVYSLDLMEYARFFPQEFKLAYMFGDITNVPKIPSVTKSRPVDNNNNSILMKFDKVRHFYTVNKDISFRKKRNKLIWRGAVCQPHRIRFMENFFNKTELINVGDFNKGKSCVNEQWLVPFTSVKEQLEYKFILSIEGNDVATNTKWIMSSNSLLFMTKPKFETWLMEGRLLPGYHYVEVKDDYSNLEELIHYYIEHPSEAEEIIKNANDYMTQFKNKQSEDWLHLKILETYFKKSNQTA